MYPILGASVLGILFVGYLYRAPLGWVVWKDFHTASFATILNTIDATLPFAIGNYYFGGGAYDIQKAKRYFRATLTLDAKLQGVHYQLARIYFIQSDFSGALTEIDTELTLYPDFKRSYYIRGLVYGYSGKLPEAEADFKAFLAWKPDSWAGHNDLAWIYFQEGKYIEARDTARAGLTLAPANPWLLNSLGVALMNTDDKKGAKEAFSKALTILESMSEKDWGVAYPGNNPTIYNEGFTKMKESIQENLRLLSVGDTTK